MVILYSWKSRNVLAQLKVFAQVSIWLPQMNPVCGFFPPYTRSQEWKSCELDELENKE